MSNSQQKPSWSLQDNKRSEEERKAFTPTGETPKKNTGWYIVSVIAVILLISFVLTVSSKKTLEACVTAEFCFNSKDDVLIYSLYVFSTITIIVFAVFFAYKFGQRFGNMLKR
ncbi:hypothetical protein [Formosa haliotis]|uniref:hypothetical protein n=1 Tax=Formosa haliotis TaxID=1555194 RepID=UPI000823FB47|nr:hypothetical protein [Formosa haliotis]